MDNSHGCCNRIRFLAVIISELVSQRFELADLLIFVFCSLIVGQSASVLIAYSDALVFFGTVSIGRYSEIIGYSELYESDLKEDYAG